ncbi:hypothetical protein [Nocardioides sp. TF02-7]|uniref:hypothetical protein n=1 Tax=Nocardioides sp. TF02-7 TaxID=2917724 RepID=UPI001F0578CE|nr:hypothetical protein [Nocardioides sp. TF02-7]UMG91594.1 hypothetical protein MF408_16005 [Nocardioides sp. TF02-7]
MRPLLRLWVWCTSRPRDERGDVPGWVLVTVMSVGLVGIIWTVAEDELGRMLRSALRSVQ